MVQEAWDSVHRLTARHANVLGAQVQVVEEAARFGALPVPRLAEGERLHWYPVFLIAVAVLYVLAAMIRLAYFNATEDERRADRETLGREYFTGLPVTTAALVFPLVLLLHYFLRFDLSLVYYAVKLLTGLLFLGNFRIPKPGRKALGIAVVIGGVELLAFLLIHLFGRR